MPENGCKSGGDPKVNKWEVFVCFFRGVKDGFSPSTLDDAPCLNYLNRPPHLFHAGGCPRSDTCSPTAIASGNVD